MACFRQTKRGAKLPPFANDQRRREVFTSITAIVRDGVGRGQQTIAWRADRRHAWRLQGAKATIPLDAGGPLYRAGRYTGIILIILATRLPILLHSFVLGKRMYHAPTSADLTFSW